MAKSATSVSVRVPTTAFPDANALKVSVFYDKGGMNYFNYKDEPRGYWASVRPVNYEPSNGNGFTTESFMMFATNPASFKVFLGGATRFSAKVLKDFADKVLAKATDITTLLAAGSRDDAATLLKGGA